MYSSGQFSAYYYFFAGL